MYFMSYFNKIRKFNFYKIVLDFSVHLTDI